MDGETRRGGRLRSGGVGHGVHQPQRADQRRAAHVQRDLDLAAHRQPRRRELPRHPHGAAGADGEQGGEQRQDGDERADPEQVPLVEHHRADGRGHAAREQAAPARGEAGEAGHPRQPAGRAGAGTGVRATNARTMSTGERRPACASGVSRAGGRAPARRRPARRRAPRSPARRARPARGPSVRAAGWPAVTAPRRSSGSRRVAATISTQYWRTSGPMCTRRTASMAAWTSAGVGDRAQGVERVGRGVLVDHRELGGDVRVADGDAGGEAVALGLGQRVGAVHLPAARRSVRRRSMPPGR